MMIIADKLEELVKMQVEAIKNIKIDKVTVWEGGQEKGENSKSSTANFISNLYRSVPPMQDIFDMAGMKDRKSTRLNSSHVASSYAVFCSKKKQHSFI